MPQLTSSPRPVVASTPVNKTETPEDPQFSTPQPSDPQPALTSSIVVGEPTLEVASKPDKVTTGLLLSPQGSSPHSPLPQPC